MRNAIKERPDRKLGFVLGLLALTAVLVAGCGGDDSSDSDRRATAA